MTPERVVAILGAYNEERFIGGCLEHLSAHGVGFYVIDNESTDRTVEIASRWDGSGLLGLESFPRGGRYRWRELLSRKAEIAAQIDAEWILHVDPDERHIPPPGEPTLSQALHEVSSQGGNAVGFLEYTFVPTADHPDHDHPDYEQTMRWYYPFRPVWRWHIRAWRPPGAPVDLVRLAGHAPIFAGRRLHPVAFGMRHYLYLSVEHAVRKYVLREYDPAELALGWHRARASLRPEDIQLLPESSLRFYGGDETLDARGPWGVHPLFDPEFVGPASQAVIE